MTLNGLPVFKSEYARSKSKELKAPIQFREIRDDSFMSVVGYIETLDHTNLEPWVDYDPIMEDMEKNRAKKEAQGLWLYAGD